MSDVGPKLALRGNVTFHKGSVAVALGKRFRNQGVWAGVCIFNGKSYSHIRAPGSSNIAERSARFARLRREYR